MFLPVQPCMNEELRNKPEDNTEQIQEDSKPNPENQSGNPASEVQETELLKAQLAEANDKFLRLYAEFDNYKRRSVKEKAEILQTAGKDVMLALLPVIDDFDRAHKSEHSPDFEAYKKGIELIHQKFANILQARGLKPIDSIGMEFNVDLHEAITNIPAPSEEMKGKVIDETERGYTLNGHVIRFAKVVVGE